jgi:RND family efflux transporter MFP subunit
MVAPGSLCAQVVNFGSLKIKAELSESYSSNVKEGNEVEIRFPDINRVIQSKVNYVSQAINPMTRTFGVEIELPSDRNFRPNMVAVIRIADYQNNRAIVVPVNTIQSMDGHDHVYVAVRKGNRMVAEKRDIQVGLIYNGKAEVKEGLKEGDQLITIGYQDLNENELIRF